MPICTKNICVVSLAAGVRFVTACWLQCVGWETEVVSVVTEWQPRAEQETGLEPALTPGHASHTLTIRSSNILSNIITVFILTIIVLEAAAHSAQGQPSESRDYWLWHLSYKRTMLSVNLRWETDHLEDLLWTMLTEPDMLNVQPTQSWNQQTEKTNLLEHSCNRGGTNESYQRGVEHEWMQQ